MSLLHFFVWFNLFTLNLQVSQVFFFFFQKYYVWNLRITYKICLFRCWKTCFFCFPVFLDFRWWFEIAAGHLAMFLVSDKEGHVLFFCMWWTNTAWFDQDACINQTRMCQQNKSWLANNMWTFNHKPWTIFCNMIYTRFIHD